MLRKCVIAAALVAAVVVAGSAQTPTPNPAQQQKPTQPQPGAQAPAAQAPATPTPGPSATPAPAAPAAQASASTTLSGCVYLEKDVPGRKPNIVERAGVLEDYILATMATTPSATPGATGTGGSSTGKMYKLEKIDDDKLKALVGKRVEVTGRVDQEADDVRPGGAPQRNTNIGPDDIELPEFEVTSIREIPGTCPASPAAR